MSQLIDLGKLRFHFAGEWSNSTTYESNDIVKYGGNVYVYTYALKTAGVLPTNSAYWVLMLEGFKFTGVFNAATQYKVGDGIAYGGKVYVSILDSTGIIPPNTTYWSQFADGIQYEGTYSATAQYQKNDIVVYGASVYIAKQDTTNNNPVVTAYWDKFVEGVSPQSIYNNATAYAPNDLVAYGPNIYRAKVNTTGNLPTSTTQWELYVSGTKFNGVYSASTTYYLNDIVLYGPNLYRAKLTLVGSAPIDGTNWELITGGTKFNGVYSAATTYYLNDIVLYGPNLYRAKLTLLASTPIDGTNWELIIGGTKYNGTYSASTTYYLNDVVLYGPNLYRAKLTLVGSTPQDGSNWEQISGGSAFRSSYSASTTYYLNDIVEYGANYYRSTAVPNQTGVLPTNQGTWAIFASGFSYVGTYATSTQYYVGQVVSYGGSIFKALRDTLNENPATITAAWVKIVSGFKNRGTWATATQYGIDEVVVYGGNTYITLIPHASTTFDTDLTAAKWQKFNSGVRWRGAWASTITYLKDDIVKDSLSNAYIASQDHVSTSDFAADRAALKWELFVSGAGDVFPATVAGDTGRSLTLAANGSSLTWAGTTESNKVYYVAPHGTDLASSGKNMSTPFASIKYATTQCGTDATIFVKTGTYSEQLPITIPANTAIVGDNQRTVIVQPKTGNSDDGTTPNAQATMFLMSNGSILNKMTFKSMTGWVPGTTTADITTSTIKGVVTRLNPASPITTKSPYVLECSAIGTGCIGALIDGSVHATGAKTMIFHGYTIISDNGIGYWVKDGGKAEIVSCFTYYCYFGYTASGGGFIRALNGNNSYGTWGATARGFDTSETPHVATVFGQQLNFVYQGGNINTGDTLTASNGATAIVTNVQANANKVYVSNTTGTFVVGNTLAFTSGGVGTIATGGLENQKGFILILTGFTIPPTPGASITLADDSISYVIQSVSGTYVNTSSKLVIVLAQEKPTGSPNNTSATIRYNYSQVRLTGHDFLSIGTGGVTTTNYPGTPTQPAAQGNEVDEAYPGRVYYVSTDQNGNFRVGEYFRIDQATGTATLNANAFNLAGLTSLKLGSIGAQLGETINEFSSDATMSGNSNVAVPTEYAVKQFATRKAGDTMTGALILSGSPTAKLQAATKDYVDRPSFITYINL